MHIVVVFPHRAVVKIRREKIQAFTCTLTYVIKYDVMIHPLVPKYRKDFVGKLIVSNSTHSLYRLVKPANNPSGREVIMFEDKSLAETLDIF